MTKKILLLILVFLTVTVSLSASSPSREFAMFKRTVSPVWLWGDNGLLTVAKATPVGKYNFYSGINIQEAGFIQNEQLFNTSLSFVGGTSDDVELGFTQRQLFWENGDITDLRSYSFYTKVRVLNLFGGFIETSAIMQGTSLQDNQFDEYSDILFNPGLVATINFPKILGIRGSVTGSGELLFNDGEESDMVYNLGADLSFFNDRIFLVAEYQGMNAEQVEDVSSDVTDTSTSEVDSILSNAVLNMGVRIKILQIFNAGIGVYNLTGNLLDSDVDDDQAYIMTNLSVSIPLGTWIRGE